MNNEASWQQTFMCYVYNVCRYVKETVQKIITSYGLLQTR